MLHRSLSASQCTMCLLINIPAGALVNSEFLNTQLCLVPTGFDLEIPAWFCGLGIQRTGYLPYTAS